MPRLAEHDQCCGCSACVMSCKKKCMIMTEDDAGFSYPVLAWPDKCIHCRQCENACPVLLKQDIPTMQTKAYAAFAKDKFIRAESSSGGLFSLLAEHVLKKNGTVYGAAFDQKYNVRHVRITDRKDIWMLRGAKYAQSELGDSFLLVEKDLQSGMQVLFSGTPCQVAGLKAYLGRNYDGLICCDFVCHGVPSAKVWREYIRYHAQKDNEGSYPLRINMRSKESGWSNYSYSTVFEYKGGKRYKRSNSDDVYMKLFVGDYILRESCGSCKFKGYERHSDITLGDFWGIWDVAPEMDDNAGTSVILIHTAKGLEVFETLEKAIVKKECTLEEAGRYNPSMLQSIKHKPERNEVLCLACEGEFDKICDLGLEGEKPKKRKKLSGIFRALRRR